MTKRQQAAFDHPVRLAMETIHPRYSEIKRYGARFFIITLTLNTGWE
jgi:hypothetical protein